MAPCSPAKGSQHWAYDVNSLQISSQGKCLDLVSSGDDSYVAVAPCKSKGSQSWEFDVDEGTVKNDVMPNLCLGLNAGAGECDPGSPDQKWVLEPPQALDPYAFAKDYSDAEWGAIMKSYGAPAILDSDGDGFINRTGAELAYHRMPKQPAVRSMGGRRCTPVELLPIHQSTTDWKKGTAGCSWGFCPDVRAEVRLTPSTPRPREMPVIKKIYYINVEWSHTRRTLMEMQLRRIGLPFERFPAITADEVARGDYDADILQSGVADDIKGMNGSIACALSHRHVYEKILKEDPDGDGVYIVLEDDAILYEGWKDKLHDILLQVPDDWNCILSGWWNNARCNDVVNEHFALAIAPQLSWTRAVGEDFHYEWWYAGSSIVILSPRRLPPLLKMLKSSLVSQADKNLLTNGEVRTYASLRRLGQPATGIPSDREAADTHQKWQLGAGLGQWRRTTDRGAAVLIAAVVWGGAGLLAVGAFAVMLRQYAQRTGSRRHQLDDDSDAALVELAFDREQLRS